MMFRSQLFRKHLAITAICVLGFAFAGSLLNQFVVHRLMISFERESGERMRRPDPGGFLARLMALTAAEDPVAGMKRLESLFGSSGGPFRLALVNENKEVTYQFQNPELKFLAEAKLPPTPGEAVELGLPDGIGAGPRPAGIVRLAGPKPFFLYYELMHPGFPAGGPGAPPMPRPAPSGPGGQPSFRGPPPGPPGGHHFLIFSFLVSIVMVLAGLACALYLIFRSLREHVSTADQVISELQRGNLKARFPIRKRDEIGQAMERFNLMANEIEKLVERLRSSEQSRNFLLQDLTHDLRTPVASLRNLLDTIFGAVTMNASLQELADLAVKEVDYISRLVEDLLLLAQVSETKYKAPERPVEMVSLLEEEANALALRFAGKVKLVTEISLPEALISGDERLIQRLVRNALENAFSFAHAEVRVKAEREGSTLLITVADDGPGFSAEALEHFGERRAQRKISANPQARLSLGLGSVIMKTAAALHGGTVQASNRPNGGGVVTIRLPFSH